MQLRGILRETAVRGLYSDTARKLALTLAAKRGKGLILVYHRLVSSASPPASARDQIVPCVPETLFKEHLEALSGVGRVVSLSDLLCAVQARPAEQDRVRFAITFDDDEPSHLHYALPVLQSFGIPATFFISGRALAGSSPPWWIVLEHQIARFGFERTAAALDVHARSAGELAATVEREQRGNAVEQLFAPAPAGSQLEGRGIARLAAASGVTIGFHTLYHEPLTSLDDGGVKHALSDGRETLETLAGRPVTTLAYPHGKADARVVELARRSGFLIACRSAQRPVSAASDPLSLCRWEPGALSPRDLLAHVTFRLNLPS